MNQRILITGGAGFVGGNLVRMSLTRGHNVLNVDALTYAGNLDSLADVSDSPNYRFAQIDLTDAAKIQAAVADYRPDAILHLAAESHVDRSIDGPDRFIQTNVVGTFNLLQAGLRYSRTLDCAAAAKFRFIHVSTDEVYGSLGETGRFSETSRYDPHSPYAASKAASDHLARAWHDTYRLPVIVTHSSNNYGPFQHPEKLIPVVIAKCLAGEAIPVYGSGDHVRDWIHVQDHCRALLTIMQNGVPGEAYNIGADNERTNLQIVNILCGLFDELHPPVSSLAGSYNHLITHVTDRLGHDHRYAVDASKLKHNLNWRAEIDFESGLKETVQWYLANRHWWNTNPKSQT